MQLAEKFITKEFNKTYRGTETFCETKYFRAFLELLNNTDLLGKIKFANDILHQPPVGTWVKVNKELFSETMTKGEKQGLGACFGYLYRFIYSEGYEPRQAWVNDEITGIRTASYFKIKNKGEQ